MAGEKTEQPTPRRLQEARRKGQVAMSREMNSALTLFAAFAMFRFGGEWLWRSMEQLLIDSFMHLNDDPLSTGLTASVGPEIVWHGLVLLLPLALLVAGVGILSGLGQTGGVFAPGALRPQASRMNPLKGAQRVFASKQSAMQLAKALAKFALIGGIAALTLRAHWHELIQLGLTMPLTDSLALVASIGFDVTLRVLMALTVLAVADFAFQRREWITQLRMTRREVEDEHKQSDGDPHMKAAMARQRRSFLARALQAVPHADVVLVNPTHYAVALKYDPASDAAPRVLAKGQDLIAQRIRELAIEHRIPVIQNPPLTRAIHRAVPVGKEVTPELYEAVAEVLAFVYRLRYPQPRTAPATR